MINSCANSNKLDKITTSVLIPENYVAIYARHSIDKKESVSNEAQFSICREIAKKYNLIVYHEYGDQGTGLTVAPEMRKEFQKLLSDAKSGFFKTIIIWKIDRFSRNPSDFYHTRALFEGIGVKLIFGDMIGFEGLPSLYKDFMENTFISLAYLEPNRIKEKANASRAMKRELGIYPTSNCPFGYEAVKAKEYFSIEEIDSSKMKLYYIKEPLKSKLVEAIFNKYISSNDVSIKDIYKEFESLYFYFNQLNNVNIEDFTSLLTSLIEDIDINISSDIKVAFNCLLGYEINTDDDLNSLKALITTSLRYLSKHASIKSILGGSYYGKLTPKESKSSTITIIRNSHNELIFNDEAFKTCINFEQITSVEKYKMASIKLYLNDSQKDSYTNYFYKGLFKCLKCHRILKSKDNKTYSCGCSSYNKLELLTLLVGSLINDGFINFLSQRLGLKIEKNNDEVKKKYEIIAAKEKTRHLYTLNFLDNKCTANTIAINKITLEITALKKQLQDFLIQDYPLNTLLNDFTLCKNDNKVIKELLVNYFDINIDNSELFLRQIINCINFRGGECIIEYK